MKLIDRIRPIAESDAYTVFRVEWELFVLNGQTGLPGHVSILIQSGQDLHRLVLQAAAEHARDQVRSWRSLTEAQADLLILEAREGTLRRVRGLMPALAEYIEFVERVMALRRPQPPVEA